MGLELKGVPYTLHEVDPYHKSPEFLAVSPRGLVPSVVHQGRSVYESSVVLEYLEEAFPERPRLLAADAYGRALQRIWGDHINKKIVALFYRLLQAQDKEGREAAARGYTEAWRKLFEVYPQAGPFFFGRQPGFIDLMAAPWAARELVLTHFRGYSAPADLKEYHSWWDAMQKHPSFLATKADDEKLIQVYQRYADNSAQSLVAKATRAGTELP